MFRTSILRASGSAGPCSSKWLLRPSALPRCRYIGHDLYAKFRANPSTSSRVQSSLKNNHIRISSLQQVQYISSSSRLSRFETRDTKREEEIRNEKLRADPDAVSTTSTVTPIFGEQKTNTPAHEANDVDMLAGLTSDLRAVRDTFRLQDVPKEVFYIGMAGLIPYVATTLSTIYLAWDIKYSQLHSVGYLVQRETAEGLLHILEPLQVGYGAVILSFLAAIHWGLEFAGYGNRKSVRRYAIGLIAPALAWPTILLPLHEALLAQFVGFTGMYFFDTAATTAGLAPPWYNTYRFVLTFVVGTSIVLTLIARGKIGDDFAHVPNPTDHLREIRAEQRRNVEKERDERLLRLEIQSHKKESEKNNAKNSENSESHSENTHKEDKDVAKAGAKHKEEGGVKPGDKNEPIREEMRSKPHTKPATPQGPEPSREKKANVKPEPERRNIVKTNSEPLKNVDQK